MVGNRGEVYNEGMDMISVFELEHTYLEAAVRCLKKET